MAINDSFPGRPISILGLCNPLLDISAYVDKADLEKFQLKPNNVIKAGDKQKDLCSYLVKNYHVEYTAGGSTQNSMRVIAGLLRRQKLKANIKFTGSIGEDEFGHLMAKKAQEDGVQVNYQVNRQEPSGTCAVLLTDKGKNRSLCAFLGASLKFSYMHLLEHWNDLVEDCDIIYISGFLLTTSVDTFMLLGRHAVSRPNKTYCLNLSAPYVSELYGDRLLKVIPYVDIIFGNDSEAEAYANLRKWPKSIGLKGIAAMITSEPKMKPSKERIVVITRGQDPVIVATRLNGEMVVEEFICQSVKEDEIVDSNGAGDAFVGGFLSQYAQQASLSTCIEVGCYAAREIIKHSGIIVPKFEELPKILKKFEHQSQSVDLYNV